MNSKQFELVFQSDPIYAFGIAFTIIADALHYELPSLHKTRINLIPGMFSPISAVAEGEADMGLTTPPVGATLAYRGLGPFKKKMKNLRAIGSFPHDDRLMWAVTVDSGVNSIEEMIDKPGRLVLRKAEHPVRFVVEKILEAYGTSLNDLKRCGWQIIEESHTLKIPVFVTKGKADAVIDEARKTPPWIQLTESRSMKFLPIREDVLQKMEEQYGYRKAILSKGTLRGVEKDVPCIDFSEWLLFVRDDMADDLAYLIARIFDERRGQFEAYFRNTPLERSDLVYPIDMKMVWRNVGDIPLHPGAERYYKEHGYM